MDVILSAAKDPSTVCSRSAAEGFAESVGRWPIQAFFRLEWGSFLLGAPRPVPYCVSVILSKAKDLLFPHFKTKVVGAPHLRS